MDIEKLQTLLKHVLERGSTFNVSDVPVENEHAWLDISDALAASIDTKVLAAVHSLDPRERRPAVTSTTRQQYKLLCTCHSALEVLLR